MDWFVVLEVYGVCWVLLLVNGVGGGFGDAVEIYCYWIQIRVVVDDLGFGQV